MIKRIWICCALLVGVGGCQLDPDVATPPSVADVVQEDPRFGLLRLALRRAGLNDALRAGNLTLFAPTDSAFASVGIRSNADLALLSDSALRQTLLYHIVYGAVRSDAPQVSDQNYTSVRTANGAFANVGRFYGQFRVNGGTIPQPDKTTANGVVQVVDRLLTPPNGNILATLQRNPNLSLLVAALNRTLPASPALADRLTGPGAISVTVLAPTNDAFRAAGYDVATINTTSPQALATLLSHHVLNGPTFSYTFQQSAGQANATFPTLAGGQLTVGRSTATNVVLRLRNGRNVTPAMLGPTDVLADNGVIHLLDQVLY